MFFALPGRVELVKTCLSAMAIYKMMATPPPAWHCKRVDGLRRGFIWAKDEVATGGQCLTRWSLVYQPKDNGGLGLTDLQKHSCSCTFASFGWHGRTQCVHGTGFQSRLMPQNPFSVSPLLSSSAMGSLWSFGCHIGWKDSASTTAGHAWQNTA